jgi:cell division protein ZapA
MESSTPEKQSVRVTILSRPYTLLAAGDPREVEEVASSVNDLMLSIAAKVPNADSTRIAVLACLHMADKLRSLERDLNLLKERVDRKSIEFAGMLEQLMTSAGEP